MPTLLRPWKRLQREEPQQQAEIVQERRPGPAEPRDLFLLLPTDGGLSFRLFTFTGEQAAAAYLSRLATPMGATPRHVAFRALHHLPDAAGDGALEAVVLVRDAHRPGMVYLYSFVSMELALDYLRQEEAPELDLVLLYWAAPVELPLAEAGAPATEEDPAPAPPAISIPLPPRPAAAMQGVGRSVRPACPTQPAIDTRVRIPVTPNGAVFEPEPEAAPAPAQSAPRTGLLAGLQAWSGWDGLAPLVVRASLLNERTYEEFDRDPHSLGRGRLVLGLAVLAAAVGASGAGITAAIVHAPAFLLGWAAFVFAVYSIGTQAFPGRKSEDTLPRLVRSLGLAAAPALILVLGVLPTYGPLFVLAAYMWMLLTTTAAIAVPLQLARDSCIIVATVGTLVLFTVSQVAPLLIV